MLWLQVGRATQCGWFHTGPTSSGGKSHTVWVVPDMCYGFRWAGPHSVGGSTQVLWLQVGRATQCGWFQHQTGAMASGGQSHTVWVVPTPDRCYGFRWAGPHSVGGSNTRQVLWLQVGRATQCGWFQHQTGAMASGGQGHTVWVVPHRCYGFRWAEPHSVGGSNTRQVLWLQVGRATQCGWFQHQTGAMASSGQGHTVWVVPTPDRCYGFRWAGPHSVGGSNTRQVLWLQVGRATQCGWFQHQTGAMASGGQSHTVWVVPTPDRCYGFRWAGPHSVGGSNTRQVLWLQVGRATQCGWFQHQTGAMASGGQGHTVWVVPTPDRCYGFRWAEPHSVGGSNTRQVLWLQVGRATQCGWFQHQTGAMASGGQSHTVWVVPTPDRCYGFRWAGPHSVGGSTQVLWLQVGRATQCGWFQHQTGAMASGGQGHTVWVVPTPDRCYGFKWAGPHSVGGSNTRQVLWLQVGRATQCGWFQHQTGAMASGGQGHTVWVVPTPDRCYGFRWAGPHSVGGSNTRQVLWLQVGRATQCGWFQHQTGAMASGGQGHTVWVVPTPDRCYGFRWAGPHSVGGSNTRQVLWLQVGRATQCGWFQHQTGAMASGGQGHTVWVVPTPDRCYGFRWAGPHSVGGSNTRQVLWLQVGRATQCGWFQHQTGAMASGGQSHTVWVVPTPDRCYGFRWAGPHSVGGSNTRQVLWLQVGRATQCGWFQHQTGAMASGGQSHTVWVVPTPDRCYGFRWAGPHSVGGSNTRQVLWLQVGRATQCGWFQHQTGAMASGGYSPAGVLSLLMVPGIMTWPAQLQ